MTQAETKAKLINLKLKACDCGIMKMPRLRGN